MSAVGLYVAVVGGGLFLLGLGVFAVTRVHERRTAATEDDRSPAAIIARVQRERAAEDFRRAPTEVFPALSPDDVPTMPIPVPVPLPRRRRPYVERRPTPWPRQDLDQRPAPELMRRILDGLNRLD